MPFIPHTAEEKLEMLSRIGVNDLSALFDEIPAHLRHQDTPSIPPGLGEMAMTKVAESLANENQPATCFIGAGSYDHYIPAAVWDLASRGEFLTAYTPYQAEASQGTLQLLYEFQTMMAELTGMDIANASLYDGASALAEAILMAVRLNQQSRANRILLAGTLHPLYHDTIETIVRNQQIEVITLPFDGETGVTPLEALQAYRGEDITAVVIAQPNFFGCLETVDELCDWAHDNQALCIACVNPTSLALLKPPGMWGKSGADIACGEGQPLGVPMASGGPYFGFLSTRMNHVRQMPGRLIGRTQDKAGQVGYALTLQAREQHIRRAKATSNICTNQGLLVTAASIYLSLMGAEGLAQVASSCHQRTQELVAKLTKIDGIELVFSSAFFHEALIRFNRPIHEVLAKLRQHGIDGGYAVEKHFPSLKNTLLVCATEKRSSTDIEKYVQVLK